MKTIFGNRPSANAAHQANANIANVPLPRSLFKSISILDINTQPTIVADEWVAAIKKNPEKFPILSFFVWLKENGQDSEYRKASYKITVIPIIVAGGAVGFASYFASKNLPMATNPISRRDLLKTALAGTGLIAAGRSADTLSTMKFSNDFGDCLQRFQNLEEFKQLPHEVQQRILPPANSLEGNPSQMGRINGLSTPGGAARRIVSETFGFVAILGFFSALRKLAQGGLQGLAGRDTEKPPIARRAFLSYSAFISATSLIIADWNLSATSSYDNSAMAKELEELHKIMSGSAPLQLS